MLREFRFAIPALTLTLFVVGAHSLAPRTHPSTTNHTFSECDPLVPEQCMLPFPNNFWLRPTAADPSVLRLAFTNTTFPHDASGHPIDALKGGWDTLDGFSPMPVLMAYFPNASLTGCARLWNIETSLSSTSPIVVLDTVTNKPVPHWVELDRSSAKSEIEKPEAALMIWPASRLENGRRYIVAIRDMVDTSGSPLKPSQAFVDLRNNITSSNWDIEGRRKLFQDIFTRLEAAGVKRASLQLAWDFTVGSRTRITERMVHMRDDGFARIPASGPTYEIDLVTENVSDAVARRIQGHFYVPWYLNYPGLIPGLNSRLVLGSDGLPVYQSMQPINFTVVVPRSLANGSFGSEGRLVQYGHGLFGDQKEVNTGYLVDEANRNGYLLGAVDWIGLSEFDAASVALMIATDLSDFAMIPDRCTQGMLNALLMMRFMSTSLAKDPLLSFNGKPIVNTAKRNYYGNSQGGILGTVYMGLTTEVERGAIGVGGGPYALLLPRSQDFSALFDVLRLRYPNDLDRISLLSVFQLLWDRLEPSGYVDSISRNPLPNTPKHRVIMHYGLADAQVSWLGMHEIARSTDAVMFESNVREGNITLFGFPFVPDDTVVTTGNVVMGWDFGEPLVPFTNVPPPKEYDTHEFTRRTPTAQEQMHVFFETGNIINTCKGACKTQPPLRTTRGL